MDSHKIEYQSLICNQCGWVSMLNVARCSRPPSHGIDQSMFEMEVGRRGIFFGQGSHPNFGLFIPEYRIGDEENSG